MADVPEILQLILADGFPWLLTFLVVTFLFGTLFFIFTKIYNLEEKSDYTGSHYYLRAYLVAILSALVIIFVEFIFVLLLLSPVFLQHATVSLIENVLTTALNDIIIDLMAAAPEVILMTILLIGIATIIISYIMLEFFQINFGWTTLITWSAAGLYFAIDSMIDGFAYDGGIAGLLNLAGRSISDWILGLVAAA